MVEIRLVKLIRNVFKFLFFGDVMLVWDCMSYIFDWYMFWEVRNKRKGGFLIGLDLFYIDE